ncbi:hypothetical protein BOW35_08570 [Solemya velum gill symbiont]|uniref:GntR family transcriptional regulator n=1 Tax=Solemya velum gill symbiont TaxID=2340 RepID=UPI0009964A05|nr:GntR family transcriptional regulator [Solemya velum gill symbiont]OOZ14499.1 hypothetical protein BOW27_07305 [Solemya velum gill symbiont]OOZ19385.1 hypothetical protein BOW29_07465 [Solemya velum gill symbiont]OOZ21749.1 hypothetical protein BOW30_08085 [Solemya velum gill symbiont]OOZ24325.1 hypothetical protein BOW31_06965 [Solemya velum gill symbiont]OOZ28934.1 hypothetical protein BOW33_07645 [Solemya velum gill symbiont]
MNESTPKYILVENYILQAIRNKEFTDKLPGERILAKKLDISYMTVRKGITNLVDQGTLYKIPTKGTFVNKRRQRKKITHTIGYFLDSRIQSGISNPYYSLLFNAIEKKASKQNFSVIYFTDSNETALQKTLSKLDGVIATCFPRLEETIQLIKQTGPVVVLENSAADKSIPSVIIDNFNANMESVDFICSLGHQQIGFMTSLEDSDIGNDRYTGYLHGLRQNGITPDEKLLFKGDNSFESGAEGAEYFLALENSPTAIICANDSMALGTMSKLNEVDLKVPDDISIIGFDDIEIASQITPSLTTVSAPVNEIAEKAFSALHKLIQGGQPEFRHISLSAKLIIRKSCSEKKKRL